jgi:hypothetical protein
MTHTEVQNSFLKDGAAGIESIIENSTASPHTLRRALRELRDDPGSLPSSKIDDLEHVLDEHGFMSTAVSKPDVGDHRSYKIQEESGRQVLKVPVDYLQQATGSEISVSFDVNGFRGAITDG